MLLSAFSTAFERRSQGRVFGVCDCGWEGREGGKGRGEGHGARRRLAKMREKQGEKKRNSVRFVSCDLRWKGREREVREKDRKEERRGDGENKRLTEVKKEKNE